MEHLKNKVDKLMTMQINKNKSVINNALIEPLAPNYQFSTNGIYFLCNKMGGGKTFWIMRHIMITERLFNEPYYDTIIFSSTSGTLDKTVSSLQSQIQTPITYIKDTELMQFLTKHLKNKMKFYSVMEFLNSNGKEINEQMEHLIEKHHFIKFVKGKKTFDIRRMINYVQISYFEPKLLWLNYKPVSFLLRKKPEVKLKTCEVSFCRHELSMLWLPVASFSKPGE